MTNKQTNGNYTNNNLNATATATRRKLNKFINKISYFLSTLHEQFTNWFSINVLVLHNFTFFLCIFHRISLHFPILKQIQSNSINALIQSTKLYHKLKIHLSSDTVGFIECICKSKTNKLLKKAFILNFYHFNLKEA